MSIHSAGFTNANYIWILQLDRSLAFVRRSSMNKFVKDKILSAVSLILIGLVSGIPGAAAAFYGDQAASLLNKPNFGESRLAFSLLIGLLGGITTALIAYNVVSCQLASKAIKGFIIPFIAITMLLQSSVNPSFGFYQSLEQYQSPMWRYLLFGGLQIFYALGWTYMFNKRLKARR